MISFIFRQIKKRRNDGSFGNLVVSPKIAVKLLPFILMLALAGCGNRESRDKQMAQQINQWVPMWTSLQTTRQIMEQHQFACSTISYDSIDQMSNSHGEAFRDEYDLWTKFVDQKGKTQTVTNITHLKCQTAKFDVLFIIVNDKETGFQIRH